MIDSLPADFRPDTNVEIHKMDTSIVWSENNIFFIYAMPNADHTLEHAKRQTDFFKSNYLSDTIRKRPMICDVRTAKPIKKDVRDYYASETVGEYTEKFAFLVDSPVSMVIANFAIGFKKMETPLKMFRKKEDAILWCNEKLL